MEDHNYTKEFKWEKPLLTLNQLAVLAVLNSERKSLSADTIAVFLYKHFPYYSDTPLSYISHLLKTTSGVLLQRIYEPSDYCEYYIPVDKEQYCIKRFQRFYSQHPDPKSPVYSMRYPGYWDSMAKGEYREGEPLPDVLLNSQPAEWPKPPIPERYLIGLAIMNSQNGRLLASEIFAFIERHFPYYKTADKKWKKQNANEALKAARGIFGREKLSTPASTDKLGNGILNVYYIKEDRIATITNFFEKFQKEHSDPKTYGMENPDLWPTMVKGQLKQNEDDLRKLVFSHGKAKSQLASTDRNPYEKGQESIPTVTVKPKLDIVYFALLAYLHSDKKLVTPSEIQAWIKENIYYFNSEEAKGWKSALREVLHQFFKKTMVDDDQKLNTKYMTFELLEESKKKLIRELVTYEKEHSEISAVDYGIDAREEWEQIFPEQFKDLVEETPSTGGKENGDGSDWDLEEEIEEDEGIEQDQSGCDDMGEKEDDSKKEEEEGQSETKEADDMEEFVYVEDYSWYGGQKEGNKKNENEEIGQTIITKEPVKVEEEIEKEGRYQTRNKRIDFNKMLSFDNEKKKGSFSSDTTSGRRKRSGEQEGIQLKRRRRNAAGRHSEEESISQPSIPVILLIYLAMLNSDQKMASLDEIMNFLGFYFGYYEKNKGIAEITAAVRSVLIISFTKRDSFDGDGNVRYGYPPSTDKELRKRVDTFGDKYPRSMEHVYGLRNIGLWEKMQLGELREHSR